MGAPLSLTTSFCTYLQPLLDKMKFTGNNNIFKMVNNSNFEHMCEKNCRGWFAPNKILKKKLIWWDDVIRSITSLWARLSVCRSVVLSVSLSVINSSFTSAAPIGAFVHHCHGYRYRCLIDMPMLAKMQNISQSPPCKDKLTCFQQKFGQLIKVFSSSVNMNLKLSDEKWGR